MTSTPPTAASPETILQLQAGVPAAFAMLAGMRLEVFTALAEGPLDAEELAGRLGVDAARLSRLLYALVLCRLLRRAGDRFANMPEAQMFLVKGQPGYLGGTHELLGQLWQADLRTTASIRDGRPAALHDFSAAPDDEMAAMLRGMHAGAVASGWDLLRHFDFSDCRSVIDIGGGSGGLVATLCAAHPGLRGTLFDLPGTVALAGAILAETAGGERVVCEAGDILATVPPGPHDAAVLRALVQVLRPEQAARSIGHAAAALRPGGTLYVLGGGILDDDRLGPASAVFLNLTFLNLYDGGASYTEAQHRDWLAAAGCGAVRRTRLPNGASIISATRL